MTTAASAATSSATPTFGSRDAGARTAVVIGAGSMGAGIAALLASAGVHTTLLDMRSDGEEPNERAITGKELQRKRGGFTHPRFEENLSVGNTTDNLDQVAQADLVIEAIFENLDAKRTLYAQLEPHLGEHTVVASNTSTLPLAKLTAELPAEVASRFYITHFFNPPRVMRLVELVAGEGADADTTSWLRDVLSRQLGKSVLDCKDTPGFIANRVGNLWMAAGVQEAFERGIEPELADALFSKPFGIPRTGIFGLFDYVGIQLVPGVWGGYKDVVGPEDAYQRYDIAAHPVFQGLIERGWTGRTGESGFYKGRTHTLDLAAVAEGQEPSFEYRERIKPEDPALAAGDLAQLLSTPSRGGEYARDIFATTLVYCCDVATEIAHTVADIDAGFELGFAWRQGPFKLADAAGIDAAISAVTDAGFQVPALLEAARDAGGFYPAAGEVLDVHGQRVPVASEATVVRLEDVEAEGSVLFENDGATVTLLDNGTAVFATHTKMGSMSVPALELLNRVATEGASAGVKALVITGRNPKAFCAGADISMLSGAVESGERAQIEQAITNGIEAFQNLRYAPFPVIGAVRGVALGGGCELAMHCDRVVAHVDANFGFPERLVGILAAWGGVVDQSIRAQQADGENWWQQVFERHMAATPTRTAYEAQDVHILRPEDQVVMSADHVLSVALAAAADLAADYQAPAEPSLEFYTGPSLAADLEVIDPSELSANPREAAGQLTETDARFARAIESIVRGEDAGSATESELYDRAVAAACDLVLQPENAQRLTHMAAHMRPLRN